MIWDILGHLISKNQRPQFFCNSSGLFLKSRNDFRSNVAGCLTEVAGEGGPHLAPQKFLLSQKFRHLMRCKKYLEKNFLSCLVSEIQLFVYIFG